MSKEPTKFTIGSNNYIIGDWSVDKALETMVWLTKTFGEGLLSLFMNEDGMEMLNDMAEGHGVEGEKNQGAMEKFVAKLFEKLDAKEYVKYSKLICAGSHVNGQEINFNQHFAGKVSELHQVMFRILRHQYGDFLGGNAAEE